MDCPIKQIFCQPIPERHLVAREPSNIKASELNMKEVDAAVAAAS